MLTRDDFVKYLSTGRPLADATIRKRSSYLFRMYRELGDGGDDLSFLNSYSKVVKFINRGESLEGRKTILYHVVSLLDSKAGKAVDANSRKQIKASAVRERNQSMARTVDNVATKEQVAMYLSVPDMTTQLDDAITKLFISYDLSKSAKKVSDAEFAKWDVPSDRLNIKRFARDFQKCLMVACYTLQPALRSDWSTLEITSAAINRLSDETNWLQVLRGGRVRILMNKFKNVKHMGKQAVEVESPLLKRYLRYWIDLLTRLTGSAPQRLFIWNLSPVNPVAISTTNRESFGKAVTRATEGILSKRQTVNSFRHAHEVGHQRDPKYQDFTVLERDQEHSKLLHSHRTGLIYNWQIRDYSKKVFVLLKG